MLNERGTNFSICTLPPRMPPVVSSEVIEKEMAFCTSVKSSLAASGPPKHGT